MLHPSALLYLLPTIVTFILTTTALPHPQHSQPAQPLFNMTSPTPAQIATAEDIVKNILDAARKIGVKNADGAVVTPMDPNAIAPKDDRPVHSSTPTDDQGVAIPVSAQNSTAAKEENMPLPSSTMKDNMSTPSPATKPDSPKAMRRAAEVSPAETTESESLKAEVAEMNEKRAPFRINPTAKFDKGAATKLGIAKRGTAHDIVCTVFFPFCHDRKGQALG